MLVCCFVNNEKIIVGNFNSADISLKWCCWGFYSSQQYQSFIGRLVSKDNILLISQNVIEIGRNSSKSSVDFHVGKNSFVSRKHLILHYDGHEFNLVCASKNGVFIDDQFIRKSTEPTRLPSS